jgi:Spy/CpxP family protein refolding chaperone
MNDSTPIASTPNRRRRFLVGATLASVVAAGLGAGAGVKAFAHGGGHRGWHRGAFLGDGDPARMEERLDRMLRHLYVEIDATEAQQQRLAPIVKDAVRELAPLRAQLHDARRQVVELLARDPVDRGALEALCGSTLRLAEQASTRFTQGLADVADVLTAEQRKQLAERLARRHGHRG